MRAGSQNNSLPSLKEVFFFAANPAGDILTLFDLPMLFGGRIGTIGGGAIFSIDFVFIVFSTSFCCDEDDDEEVFFDLNCSLDELDLPCSISRVVRSISSC